MVLFCLVCNKRKATHTYPDSRFAMYCNKHKRPRMVRIESKHRHSRTSQNTFESCMICNLNFSINTACARCRNVGNQAEKLVMKYIQTYLPATGLSLNEGDHITVITANYIGNAKIKLLDLETLFNTDKLVFANFIFDINQTEILEEYLSKALESLKESIEKKITKSEIVNIISDF